MLNQYKEKQKKKIHVEIKVAIQRTCGDDPVWKDGGFTPLDICLHAADVCGIAVADFSVYYDQAINCIKEFIDEEILNNGETVTGIQQFTTLVAPQQGGSIQRWRRRRRSKRKALMHRKSKRKALMHRKSKQRLLVRHSHQQRTSRHYSV